MNNTPLPACPKILKWIFVFFNLLFAVLGILLLALGIFLVVRANEFLQSSGGIPDQPTVVTATTLGGSALIIICGLITFALAAVGVLGGICQARPLLVIFAVGLIIIVVIEFIGAVVVFVAITQYQEFVDQVGDRMRGALTLYRDPPVDEAANVLFDTVQSAFDCCGINTPDDWVGTPFFVNSTGLFPKSCCTGMVMECNRTLTSFHDNGCVPAIRSVVTNNRNAAIALGVVALLILLVEISGIVIALGLCCCIRSAKLTLV